MSWSHCATRGPETALNCSAQRRSLEYSENMLITHSMVPRKGAAPALIPCTAVGCTQAVARARSN